MTEKKPTKDNIGESKSKTPNTGEKPVKKSAPKRSVAKETAGTNTKARRRRTSETGSKTTEKKTESKTRKRTNTNTAPRASRRHAREDEDWYVIPEKKETLDNIRINTWDDVLKYMKVRNVDFAKLIPMYLIVMGIMMGILVILAILCLIAYLSADIRTFISIIFTVLLVGFIGYVMYRLMAESWG